MKRMLLVLAVLAAGPAHADWRAANPAVTEAARDPTVAEALAAATEMDVALVAKDVPVFAGRFATDAVVNSPNNNVARAGAGAQALASGVIHYRSITRLIEYAGKRANGEVVLMGEETYVPRPPHPLADKTVRRRFTDIWTPTPQGWRLSVRQATVIEVR
jgi:ketosteroid isomerase-like protein